MNQFRTNLKVLMAYRDMSVSELASLANVTKPTIYFILQGKHLPHGGTINRMATALNVGPAELFRTDLVNLREIHGREGQQ